jgi:membrane-associated phospholipid phosphatase
MIGRIVSSLRRGWNGPREVALFAGAYLTYFGVRAITEGNAQAAVDHASDLLRVERGLSLDAERWVQDAVLDDQTLVDIANAIYMYGHWPVLILGGILLFNTSRGVYFQLRNACLVSGAIGLVIFAVFPVAPPRLADLGLLDTITVHDPGYRDVLPPSLVNEYAAMPSFHAGWNVLMGIFLWRASRFFLLRAFAVVMPAAMIFAVLATGNHFVLDVVAGVGIALAALLIVEHFERRRASSTVKGDVPHAVRGRPPRRQRACPPASGGVAAGPSRRG